MTARVGVLGLWWGLVFATGGSVAHAGAHIFDTESGTLDYSVHVLESVAECDERPCDGDPTCPARSFESCAGEDPCWSVWSAWSGPHSDATCSARLRYVLFLTAYLDPESGAPLSVTDGGVRATSFPDGTELELEGASVQTTVANCLGSAGASVSIDSVSVGVTSGEGVCFGGSEIVPVITFSGDAVFEVTLEAWHHDALGKAAHAHLGGRPRLRVPASTPVSKVSWGQTKARFR